MKSILVIDMDMPSRCGECKFRSPELNPCEELMWLCKLKDDFIDRRTRPNWCPLRPMPERKEVHYTDPLFGEVENLTNIGYNKCLDDLGGTE